MDFKRWWDGDPKEIYWLEVTDRKDIGRDLNAPQLQDDGKEYYGYSLVTAVDSGDIVFHYYKESRAIVAWSRVDGQAWADDVVWGAHGTVARAAGVRPYVRPGWRLGLRGTQPLVPTVTLDDLRARQNEVQSIRDALEQRHGRPIYFPFEPPERRDLRPTQAYITKLPADIVRLFPELARPVGLSQRSQPEVRHIEETEGHYSISLGVPYRLADEYTAVSMHDPFEFDPALVERATRGHAVAQNALARFLKDNGLEARSPLPNEPNYDVAWRHNDEIYVAEVKSLTADNEDKQLRLGLGQVLHYKHMLSGKNRKVRAVLMTERQPLDLSWIDLCSSVGVILVWPDSLSNLPG